MSATSYMTMETGAATTRTRKSMFYSLAIHAFLFLWLLLVQKIVPEEVGITEITWIDPVKETAPAELPPILAKSQPARQIESPRETPSVHEVRKHFRRENPFSAVAPQPQDPDATVDKFKERLSALQDRAIDKPKKIASLSVPTPVGRSTLAGLDTEKRSDKPADLDRQGTPNAPPVELKRSPVAVQKSTMLMATIPETNAVPKMMEDTNADAQRELAGALLAGPVADRPLISFRKPTYPEWAKEEAVEGSVRIYFIVLPDGRIKENIMVQKTSGFSDFDNNAINALRTWRFEPLQGGATGEQWGTITFNYRLSDVN
jgi:TonB family protein